MFAAVDKEFKKWQKKDESKESESLSSSSRSSIEPEPKKDPVKRSPFLKDYGLYGSDDTAIRFFNKQKPSFGKIKGKGKRKEAFSDMDIQILMQLNHMVIEMSNLNKVVDNL
ncbi:unnamed protein product [Moneuplotes crassus]|uniref:Uncharacterized protein n=1 Tax=Euplotes crassus TaxID=5936 RepID=A0AAD1XEZ9_EUPCR|nr:unnamed protein product [Moneuplotes crassus]